MTKKIYDTDAYATEFDAAVMSCTKVQGEEKEVYEVVLDATLFFPEEGGQTPDHGILGGAEVLDVQIKGDEVYHTVNAPLCVGEMVHGCIDWAHRFSNMQQHTGEHIFSGIVQRKFGFDNVGFHLSDNIVTMDYNGELTDAQAAEIETEVNQVIVKNIPVEASFPSKEELEALSYRSKIEIEGQVRIVTIPGVDVCACCAPHVKRTGEIGIFTIQNMTRHRGGVRISMLCGFRALEEYRRKAALLTTLSGMFSTNEELLPGLAEKLKNTNQDLKYRLAGAKQELMKCKLAEIPKEQEDVILFETGLDTPVIRNTVNMLTADHMGICGIFSEKESGGYQFIIGSAAEDCRETADLLRKNAGAQCGGNAKMIQGSVQAERETLEALLRRQ